MNAEIKKIYDKIPDDVGFVPDRDLFRVSFYALNEDDNLVSAYQVLLNILSMHGNDKNIENTGNITYKYLVSKYDTYLEWWIQKFSETEEKYIKKDDKLKSPEIWLAEKGYNNAYKAAKTKTSYYLFGGYTEETLLNKLKIFNKLIGREDETRVQKQNEQEESYTGVSQDGSGEPF